MLSKRKINKVKLLNNKKNFRLDKFIETALFASNGYYLRKKPIGRKFDFVTSPEISQMFGEIIGVYLLYHWKDKINSKLSDLELVNQAIELNFDPSKREANVGFFENVAPAFSYGASYLESKLKAQPIEYVETKYKTPSEANQALAFANFAYESLGEEKYEEIKELYNLRNNEYNVKQIIEENFNAFKY